MEKINSRYLLRPDLLRPLPVTVQGIDCFHCKRRAARWQLHEQTSNGQAEREFSPLCSICFLYESNWAKTRRAEVDRVLLDLETELNGEFERDEQGRVSDPLVADQALSGIAMASRFVYVFAGGGRG